MARDKRVKLGLEHTPENSELSYSQAVVIKEGHVIREAKKGDEVVTKEITVVKDGGKKIRSVTENSDGTKSVYRCYSGKSDSYFLELKDETGNWTTEQIDEKEV